MADAQANFKIDEQQARDEMAKEIEEYIFDPLALLTGLLADCKEGISSELAGRLLGLVLRGARAEMEIHREGGYGAKAIKDLIAGLKEARHEQ